MQMDGRCALSIGRMAELSPATSQRIRCTASTTALKVTAVHYPSEIQNLAMVSLSYI